MRLCKVICILVIMTMVFPCINVCADDQYPWTITFEYDGVRAGGDVYSVKVNFNDITQTVSCEFKAVAFYNSDNKLLAVTTSDSEERQQILSAKCEEEPAFIKGFAWDNAQNMQPVAIPETYAFEPGIYYLCDEEPSETPKTVKLQLVGGGTPVEVKGVRPEQCYTWVDGAYLFSTTYADEEIFTIENNEFTTKENGEFLVYIKDDNGDEWYKWVNAYGIKCPQPKLYYESAYWGDGETAHLTVGLESQNSNAEITELGLFDFIPAEAVGAFHNSNVRNTGWLEKATPVEDGHVITLTEPGAYTLIAKDSWGNTGVYMIDVKDINHDRVVPNKYGYLDSYYTVE